LIWVLLGLESCVKHDEPPTSEGTPLFTAEGLANGSPFLFQGGINNYFMYTETKKLSYGLSGLEGRLGKKNCPEPCGPSLAIRFRNYTLQPNFKADSLLIPAQFSYYNEYNASHWVYALHTRQRSIGIGTPIYLWDFGNGYISSEAEPTAFFQNEGVYSVSYAGVYPNNCYSSLFQTIYLTPSRVGKNTDFSVNYIDTFQLLFNSIPADASGQVNWNFGDGKTASGNIVKHTYTNSGMYKVCMELINGADTMLFCQNVNTLDITSCKSNYHFTTSRKLDSLQFKSVVVEWTDASGTVYSSANVDQIGGSSFTIRSVKPYVLNAQNQSTYMLDVSFHCKVSNGTQTIELKNVKGVFAVAVPPN
jgi:hypothetical protein